MKTIFGVNSIAPINRKLKNGYTMYDWVKRQKCFPAFCMRTLSGEGEITADEIEFLKTRDCKIGLVIRDLTEVNISSMNGVEDGLKAIEAARKIGAPQNKGIALFVDIKPQWSINHNWMISFAQIISANGYTPAFIGNTDSSKNFNFDRQCCHYIYATKNANYFDSIFMSTEPKIEGMPIEWSPYCPSKLKPEDMHLWSCDTTTLDYQQVEDVYAKDEKVLEKMW